MPVGPLFYVSKACPSFGGGAGGERRKGFGKEVLHGCETAGAGEHAKGTEGERRKGAFRLCFGKDEAGFTAQRACDYAAFTRQKGRKKRRRRSCTEGKACGRRRRKELRSEKRTVVFRSGRALQQDFSRSVISSTSGTPRPLASFSMVASVGEEGLRPSSF